MNEPVIPPEPRGCALNRLGLTSCVKDYIDACNRNAGLENEVKVAEEALEQNRLFIQECQEKLGSHTRAMNRPTVVMCGELATFIPVPDGPTNSVWPIITKLVLDK